MGELLFHDKVRQYSTDIEKHRKNGRQAVGRTANWSDNLVDRLTNRKMTARWPCRWRWPLRSAESHGRDTWSLIQMYPNVCYDLLILIASTDRPTQFPWFKFHFCIAIILNGRQKKQYVGEGTLAFSESEASKTSAVWRSDVLKHVVSICVFLFYDVLHSGPRICWHG